MQCLCVRHSALNVDVGRSMRQCDTPERSCSEVQTLLPLPGLMALLSHLRILQGVFFAFCRVSESHLCILQGELSFSAGCPKVIFVCFSYFCICSFFFSGNILQTPCPVTLQLLQGVGRVFADSCVCGVQCVGCEMLPCVWCGVWCEMWSTFCAQIFALPCGPECLSRGPFSV